MLQPVMHLQILSFYKKIFHYAHDLDFYSIGPKVPHQLADISAIPEKPRSIFAVNLVAEAHTSSAKAEQHIWGMVMYGTELYHDHHRAR